MFNCMLIDIEGMMTNGFRMGNAEIETPRSITTAAAITAQIIAQVSSHIYGGTSINEIDRIHAPYVRKTFEKHLQQGMRWIGNEENAREYAMEMTEKDCCDAYQALEYEVNTLRQWSDTVCHLWLWPGYQLGRAPGAKIHSEKPDSWPG